MDLGVISYPAIVIICWLIGYAVKQTAIDNKWIPVIVGVAGAIIGLIAFKTVPVFPAEGGPEVFTQHRGLKHEKSLLSDHGKRI